MIIGNGLIANALKSIDTENILFFASGVSNSLEIRTSEFDREFSLLQKSIFDHSDKKLVYFSTLSINDQSKQNSLYVLHKLRIENFIKHNCKNYLILRVGNVVGKGGNPNTLFNFLKTQIINRSQFALHSKARRLLIDIDDISKFLQLNSNHIKNQTINCAFPYYYDLKEIVKMIEVKTKKTADYKEIIEGDFYKIDFDDQFTYFFSEISSDDYLKKLVQKYI